MLTPFNHTSHHPHHGLRSGILGGLAALLGIAVVGLATPFGMPLTAAVQAQESDVMSQANLLTVSGQGLVTVETSIAVVRLAVWVEGESAAAVQAEVAERTNSLVEQLRQEEVQKLQTTGISLNPRYTYQGGVTEQVGVEGQNAVQFEVPIDRAGGVLDGAIEAGATQIQSVSFKAADDVIQRPAKKRFVWPSPMPKTSPGLLWLLSTCLRRGLPALTFMDPISLLLRWR
ncbi:MAG: SIMPL domain-containing protein [Synechococcaceae cyanobacterium SM2_3_2]|nr:SIMPL domain-containing protein [Synechococcaceae cyanobacterium SM2_3_2]